MKIAIIINEFTPNIRSGIGRYSEMLNDFMARDNDVSVFTTNSGDLPVEEQVEHIRAYRPINWVQRIAMNMQKKARSFAWSRLFLIINIFFNNFDVFFLLRKVNRTKKFDLIAVHSIVHAPAGILLGLTTNVPVVFHVHSGEFTKRKGWWIKDPFKLLAMGEQLLEHISKKIIVLTREMYDRLLADGWNKEKLHIVPHGYENKVLLETDVTTPGNREQLKKLREKLGIEKETKTIVYAGRLIPQKGVFSLIEAMKEVEKKQKNIKLILVGAGMNPQVRKLIAKHNLENSIYCYYKILDIREVLNHYWISDICIFPSIFKEPFGLVALEAMSLEKPVILGDGFASLFQEPGENETVVYTKAQEPSDIAEKIITLCNDQQRCSALAKRGREYVERCLSWRNTVDKTLEVYSEAVVSKEKNQTAVEESV